MSQNEYLRKIAEGVVGFSGDMKLAVDRMNENLDKVITRHYQANHTPYAVMSFEDEAHYWEETLAEAINRVEYPNYEALEPKGVTMLQRRSYVIIRGNLKSGNTIRFDETKLNQLYINGERYTGNYTFNGETPETYEKLVVVAVQTPFNLGEKDYGKLEMPVSDFPIENAEIYANVGTYSNLQPVIEELLEDETVESFYIKGDWVWKCESRTFIKTLKTLDHFSNDGGKYFSAPSLVNYIMPNSRSIPGITVNDSNAHQYSLMYSLKNFDISNAGNIGYAAFRCSLVGEVVNIPVKGIISDYAFENCRRIKEVYVGDGVTSIGKYAFASCMDLKVFYIGDNVQSLGGSCLGAVTLRKLHLGKSITSFPSDFINTYFTLEEFTVSKGYHNATTEMSKVNIMSSVAVDTFLEIVKNCAAPGEDGRTADTMTFRIASGTRNTITAAKDAGDEKAIELYALMDSKRISITT